MMKRKRLTPLERTNKIKGLLKQAYNGLKPLSMIENVDTARAQIAVAFMNLEHYRVYQLGAVPKDMPMAIASSLTLPDYAKLPTLEDFVDVQLEGVSG